MARLLDSCSALPCCCACAFCIVVRGGQLWRLAAEGAPAPHRYNHPVLCAMSQYSSSANCLPHRSGGSRPS